MVATGGVFIRRGREKSHQSVCFVSLSFHRGGRPGAPSECCKENEPGQEMTLGAHNQGFQNQVVEVDPFFPRDHGTIAKGVMVATVRAGSVRWALNRLHRNQPFEKSFVQLEENLGGNGRGFQGCANIILALGVARPLEVLCGG